MLQQRNSSNGPDALAAEARSLPTTQERLLAVVRQLAVELRPQRAHSLRVTLGSDLDRDLGFDSLSKAELLFRIERQFHVELAEDLLGEAETAGDLLRFLLTAAATVPGSRPTAEVVSLAAEPAEPAPEAARTLTEVLDWHANAHGDRTHLLLVDRRGGETTVSYAALAQDAKRVARGLRAGGLDPGDRVAIMLPTSRAFFIAFFGALYAGGVPTPIYPPARMSKIEEHLRRQAGILDNARAGVLIATPQAGVVAGLLASSLPRLRTVTTVEQLGLNTGEPLPRGDDAQGTALLQYTSGSTGDPKGVALSHANLLANIRAMGAVIRPTAADVFVSWLPLYHDMGLIGAWLGSLYYAASAVIMSPQTFLVRPEAWLWAIHRHRGTLTAAPNFAFELCARRIDAQSIRGLDLGSLRMVANGAEPVSAATLRRFAERFAPYGFDPKAMAPVYGLAEDAVGLAFPPIGRGPVIDRIDRAALVRHGRAEPAAADAASPIELVGCGFAVPGHQLRAIDAAGREVPERVEGRLQFRGPSATAGYFRNEAKTRALFDGTWLETGDRGYLAGGEVFVTGRIKDIIIRAGRHIYPQEVEEAAGDIEGVRKGCVVVFGSTDPASGTERVILVAETRESVADAHAQLRQRIEAATAELLGTPADDTVLVPPGSVPKTSSGKLRRAAAKELYETRRLGATRRAVWRQLAHFALGGALSTCRRYLEIAAEIAYAGFWWLVIGLAAALAWPSTLVMPRARRWDWLGAVARVALRIARISIERQGASRLPAGGCVFIANHASYLDGLAIAAVVPGGKTFVAKKELERKPLARWFLQALGTIFVERSDAVESLEDARRVSAAARAGERLVFFPEGTLTRSPGLMEFKLGAFRVAADAGLPVMPLALVGTRSVLRGDQWFPRRGAIRLVVGEPIWPEGRDFQAILRLRDAARRQILARCNEPDLAA